jgi:hypothetical protein
MGYKDTPYMGCSKIGEGEAYPLLLLLRTGIIIIVVTKSR